MSRFSIILTAAGLLVMAFVAGFAWDYFSGDSIPHVAIRNQLTLFGTSIYEFHSRTGRWPSRLDDLAETSLPQRNPSWRASAEPVVILWRGDLKPDPKDNARVILAYHNAGLFSQFGNTWVLWGDLHTEFIKRSTLPELLKNGR